MILEPGLRRPGGAGGPLQNNRWEASLMRRMKETPRTPWVWLCGSFAVLAALVAVPPASAQEDTEEEAAAEESLPDAEELIEGMVEAVGGKRKLARIKNRVVTGSFEFVDQGMSAKLKSFEAEPNKSYVILDIPNMGKMEEGSTGEMCWELNPMRGPRILDGEEGKACLHRAVFQKEVRWRDLYSEVKTVGAVDIDGEKAYKVALTPTVGEDDEIWYIAADSHLVLKSEFILQHQMGKLPIVSRVQEYMEVDGIKMPKVVTMEVMGTTRKMTVESVEHNVELPEDRFEPPKAVLELKEKGRTEPEKKRRGPEIG